MKKLRQGLTASLLAALVGLAPAGAQQVPIYMDQGGAKMHVGSGGTVAVESGGTLDTSAGTLTMAAGQVGTAALAATAVTQAKIANGSVGNAQLASDSASLSKVTAAAASVSGTTISLTGALILGLKTKAQLQAYVPGLANEVWICSDCTTDGLVISTGTAAGAVARATARTTAIN